MRIVIAPDKFKGSLAAQSVAHSIVEGVRRVDSTGQMILAPMADGGEGTAEVLAAADAQPRGVDVEVSGPLPGSRAVGRMFLIENGRTAVFDMAAAAGFSQMSDWQRDPTATTTYGVGELIRHAVDHGARRILVGLGGSTTCDGGLGAAQALGAEIELESGRGDGPVTGGELTRLKAVRFPPDPLGGVEVICLHDVDNPLFGQRGAAHVFAPQKGASKKQVEQLDAGLRRLAKVADAELTAESPGTGAAGGLGFGLKLALGASLLPGADEVARAIGLDEKLAGADLCFTGEGRFDATSLGGKVTSAVARRCQVAQVPCFVLAGSVATGLLAAHEQGITSFMSILSGPMTLDQALPRTHVLVAHAAEQTMRIFFAGRRMLPEEVPE